LEAIAAMRAVLDSAAGLPDSATLASAIATWRGAGRHFEVALAPAEVAARVQAKLASIPDTERAYWNSVLASTGFPADTLRFLAVSIDSTGRPLPVMTTDAEQLMYLPPGGLGDH